MNDAVVLEDGVDEDGRRWRRDIHDVDIDQLLVLALSVLENDLVDAGLFTLRVDDVKLDSVAVDRQLDGPSDLEDLSVLLDVDLEVGLLLTLDLIKIRPSLKKLRHRCFFAFPSALTPNNFLGWQVLGKSIFSPLGLIFPAARFKPGMAGCEVRTLPLCYAVPPN